MPSFAVHQHDALATSTVRRKHLNYLLHDYSEVCGLRGSAHSLMAICFQCMCTSQHQMGQQLLSLCHRKTHGYRHTHITYTYNMSTIRAVLRQPCVCVFLHLQENKRVYGDRMPSSGSLIRPTARSMTVRALLSCLPTPRTPASLLDVRFTVLPAGPHNHNH